MANRHSIEMNHFLGVPSILLSLSMECKGDDGEQADNPCVPRWQALWRWTWRQYHRPKNIIISTMSTTADGITYVNVLGNNHLSVGQTANAR